MIMVSKNRAISTRTIVISVVIVIIVIAGFLIYYFQFAQPGPQLPSQFKLGVVLDYTGVLAACAKAEEIGIKLAVDEINAKGGIFGRIPIVLITRDGESNPATQLQRYRELVEVEKVDMVIGTCHAGGSYNIMKESINLGVPFWPSPVMAWEAYKKGERALWTFGTFVPTWSLGYGMCALAVKNIEGVKNVYLLVASYAFGWGIRDGCKAVLEKYGINVVGYDEYALGTPDFTPFINKIIAAKPDLVVTTVVGGDQVVFLKQARELGLTTMSKILIYTSHLWMKGVPPEALKGIYAVLLSYHDLPASLVDNETFKLMREFTDKVIRYSGEPPDPYTVVNYSIVYAIVKVFEKLGKIKNITPEEFYRATLELGPIMTPKGELKYTETGQPLWKYGLFLGIGKGPEERTYIYDYLRIIAVIGGEEILTPATLLGY
jgi:ABC-type branched-subunit amino acid transport system substrate-binding protein